MSALLADIGPDLWPVEGIEPYRGFTLCQGEDVDSDGFRYPIWRAVGPGGQHLLHVSRFNFHPTQARFNWLVDWGFPSAHVIGAGGGPLNDTIIDNAIAGARDATMPEMRQLAEGQRAFARLQGARA